MESSNASASSEAHTSETETTLKRNSNDVGWEYGILNDPHNLDKVRCKLCGKVMSAGVHRIKEHIARIPGNVSACPKSSAEDQAKCRNALNEAKTRKRRQRQREQDLMDSVVLDKITNSMETEADDDERESHGSTKSCNSLGPMDRFATAINLEAPATVAKTMREQTIKDALWKERSDVVKDYLAEWMYEAGIPFNAIDMDSFRIFVEALGKFGRGWRPPSQYELREPLLKKAVERTKDKVKPHEDEWKKSGCSIMTDAWSDRKRRSIMNLCVNSKEGTAFLSSKESSDVAHTSKMIFEYVDECIEHVGPEYVIQIVTDNASNNMGAAKLLKEKRPGMFWTSCAAHTINLMLESIAKLPRFKKIYDQAKALTIFIYAHHKTLAMMRSFTKKRDIVRPGVTRFASSFLTLQSIVEKKVQLKAMFTSSEWDECKWSKSAKGISCYSTVLSIGFWNGVTSCLKVFAPLVHVLRIADADRKPSMGFLYGELLQAKEAIKVALHNYPKNYEQILEIVDAKMKERLDSPLHLMAYLLNPYYHYKDPNLILDNVVSDGVVNCLEVIFHDNFPLLNTVLNVELPTYKNKEGVFGKKVAIEGCALNDDKYDPAKWWQNYGYSTPNLQRIAIRIMNLTTSSSGCERNWSAFEGIHTKKRNRLDVSRLNNLVYVQFNSRLLNKKKREAERNIDVLLANDASKAQGWIVDGADIDEEDVNGVSDISMEDQTTDRRSPRVRELGSDDFESDDEEMNENEFDFEFESDEERVLEDYGEEEEQANPSA